MIVPGIVLFGVWHQAMRIRVFAGVLNVDAHDAAFIVKVQHYAIGNPAGCGWGMEVTTAQVRYRNRDQCPSNTPSRVGASSTRSAQRSNWSAVALCSRGATHSGSGPKRRVS